MTQRTAKARRICDFICATDSPGFFVYLCVNSRLKMVTDSLVQRWCIRSVCNFKNRCGSGRFLNSMHSCRGRQIVSLSSSKTTYILFSACLILRKFRIVPFDSVERMPDVTGITSGILFYMELIFFTIRHRQIRCQRTGTEGTGS